jgi:transmembrane sensor
MLRREAASWLARLQSCRDPDVEAKFRRWRDAHVTHAAAFDRVRRSYEQAGLLRHSPASAFEEPRRNPPAQRPRYALAAAAALMVLAPAVLLLLRGSPIALGGPQVLMLATNVGEIRSVKLSDGSKVTLDSATRVEVEIGRMERKARLRSGRARFEVAPAARPFIVDLGTATVAASSGVVDVERAGPESRVAALAGTADVRQPAKSQSDGIKLLAGEEIAADAAGIKQKVSRARSPDWTSGMLEFDGTPIIEAVALANRYSVNRIRIDPDLAGLRVTGAFRAGDTDGLARALAAAFNLSMRRTADGALVLSRRSAAARPK